MYVTEKLRALWGAPNSVDINALAREECIAQIDRLICSPQLHGAEALCKLLNYLAQHTLNSSTGHLKEYQIATEVFGRAADFDPQSDASVRVQVGRLRTKLAEYYNSIGAQDPLVVDVPKGHYSLSFERRVLEQLEETQPETESFLRRTFVIRLPWMLAALSLFLFTIGYCGYLWMQTRALQRQLTPWKYSPAVAAFWSGFLDAPLDTDVVMEDDAFLVVQNISHQTFTFNDYLDRNYIGNLQSQKFSPEIQRVLHLIALKNLGRATEARMAEHIATLDPAGRKLHWFNAREYTPFLLTHNNVILLGGPLSNPWVQLFENQLNFTEALNSEGNSPVTNRAPAKGEQAIYTSGETTQYCVVAYLPNPQNNGKVLIVQGTSSEGTEAGLDFLLSEDQLSKIQDRLNSTKFPYFEVLLKTSWVMGSPLTTTIEAFRTHPDMK